MQSPLASLPFERYGQHPYVLTRVGTVGATTFIEAHCTVCNDGFVKPCMQPQRRGEWFGRFALDHAHGLRPQVPQYLAPAYGPPPTRGRWR